MARAPLSAWLAEVLRGEPVPAGAAVRAFAIAAGIGAAVCVAVFAGASALHLRLEAALALAFVLGCVAAGLMLRRTPATSGSPGLRTSIVLVACALAYFLYAGVYGACADLGHWPAWAAIVPAALAGALTAAAGTLLLASAPAEGDPATRWRTAALLAIVYLIAMQVIYHGQIELLPQEAYYWAYARHLDIGYLDHPPLLAWLIAAATLPGGGEWFVRLPALVSSLVTLLFASRYARDIAGPQHSLRTALLAVVLPYFLLIGLFMTPDGPVTAAWAAALYYLHRALVLEQPRAWLGAGVAIGLGMLAKYSMVLVPLAIVAFLLVDPKSRPILWSPWTWAAAALALALFSPVIVWNAQHGWASFAFQGSRRLAGDEVRFSFHLFLVYLLLVVITPWGIAGLVRTLRRRPAPDDAAGIRARRQWWFVLVFTVVPLAVFAFASFRSETRPNWIGPIFLAALPAIALSMAAPPTGGGTRFDARLARSWISVVHWLLLGYAFAVFYYPVFGLAGIRTHDRYMQTGWQELQADVRAIERSVQAETGRKPAVVGLDRHKTADELAYYGHRDGSAFDTTSRHLFFPEDALMYEYWTPRAAFDGRDLVLVARERADIDNPLVAARAARLGPVQTLVNTKRGTRTGVFYARVVYGYCAGDAASCASRNPAAPSPAAGTLR